MEDDGPEISVIVPVFQAEATLKGCIDALRGQRVPSERYEILLVDNNSTDGSAAIAAEYPDVRWLSESRQSAYAARNRGLAEAQGSIIAFTDPDCVPAEDWLEELTAPFAAEEIQVVLGRTRFGRRGPLLDLLDEYERVRDEEVFGGDDPRLYYGRTGNMAVRAEVFEALGPFDVRDRGSDTILARRVVDRYSCRAVTFRQRAEVTHREVSSVVDYFGKILTYGRSSAAYTRVIAVETCGRELRGRIFRRTVREGRLSPGRAVLLALLLSLGRLLWAAGAGRARLARALRRESAR